MPRRIADYPPDLGWSFLNLLAIVGAFVIAIAMLAVLHQPLPHAAEAADRAGRPVGRNTLEWATSSPPPAHNFDALPHDPLRPAGVRPADGREGAADMSDVTAPTSVPAPEMSGPVLGMVLFVASEAMFFAAFFGGTSRSGQRAGLAASGTPRT